MKPSSSLDGLRPVPLDVADQFLGEILVEEDPGRLVQAAQERGRLLPLAASRGGLRTARSLRAARASRTASTSAGLELPALLAKGQRHA